MCKHVYLFTISAIKIRAQIPCQHKNILLGLLFKAQPHFTSTSIYIDRNIGIEREPSAKQKTRNRYNK